MAAPLGEFELIARFFTRATPANRPDIVLAVGDDCALLQPPAGVQWAVSTDTLVEGVHFLSAVDPAALGHKALAVNLSDLAACGAEPNCFFLALALPGIDERWLQSFAEGLFAIADAHGCVLAGAQPLLQPGADGRLEGGWASKRGGWTTRNYADFGRAARHSASLSVKLYTMHWPMIVRFHAETLLKANPGLSEHLVVGTLARLMDVADNPSDRLSDYRYPEPEEPHPAGATAQARSTSGWAATPSASVITKTDFLA